MVKNRDTLERWLKTVTLTEAMQPLAELARTLATDLDGDAWTAPVADQYRHCLDDLAVRLAEEGAGDGERAVVLKLSSAVGDETEPGSRKSGSGAR